MKQSLVTKGYFTKLRQKIEKYTKVLFGDTSAEVDRVKKEIRELECEAVNVFKIQNQGNFSSDALKLISERLENISKQKIQLSSHLVTLERNLEESIDASQSADYIQEKLVAFENGFHKSTPAQRKRFVRKTIQQVVLKADSLAIWFFQSEEDETPGRKLKLVRDESHESGHCLVFGLENSEPKQQAPILVNGRVGDATSIRTKDLRLRRALLYPAELWHHMEILKEQF